MSSKISSIKAREILDSRGVPTVQAEVLLESGDTGVFSVPSGASTGEHEALELRDLDSKRYFGKGALKAVQNVNDLIKPALIGFSSENQRQIDRVLLDLDGTENKSKLGANAMLGVSVACVRAAAAYQNKALYSYLKTSDKPSLPVPMMNIINGGAHANNKLDIQEFMIIPHGFQNFRESLRAGSEIFHTLKQILSKSGQSTAVGDEGGFAPSLKSNRKALNLVMQSIEQAGYQPGSQVSIALDAAASEFYSKETNKYLISDLGEVSSKELNQFWIKLCTDYPIISLEDGLDENDWTGWAEQTKLLGEKIQLVGDDLFVTSPKLLKKGVEKKIANAILIKLNQIGTLSETLEAISFAKKNNYKHVISHRSGETEDTSIADLAVATCAPYIKTGSLSRSERIAKYNRLLVIEEELGL